MRAILLALLLTGCAAAPKPQAEAGPAMVMTNNSGDSVRLLSAPCQHSSGWLSLRAASMVYRGKTYEACWMLTGSTVLIIDSAGDASAIPMDSFRPDDGA